ncbi:MAG: hypothetical protein WCK84_01210 [Bacteroidota bacterium]
MCRKHVLNKIEEHKEYTLEGMHNGTKDVGKCIDEYLKNVERCDNLRKSFHGL